MFKPITAGLFGVATINRKLREIWAAIDELRSLAGVVSEQAESVTKDSAETVIEIAADVAKEVVEEAIEDAFDWKTTEDAAALKEWALDEHGLEIKGNKKADTIRKEILGFLSIED